jgi:hypothetical protein
MVWIDAQRRRSFFEQRPFSARSVVRSCPSAYDLRPVLSP